MATGPFVFHEPPQTSGTARDHGTCSYQELDLGPIGLLLFQPQDLLRVYMYIRAA
jgi:hypothetical protein